MIAALYARLERGWQMCDQERDPTRRRHLEDHWQPCCASTSGPCDPARDRLQPRNPWRSRVVRIDLETRCRSCRRRWGPAGHDVPAGTWQTCPRCRSEAAARDHPDPTLTPTHDEDVSTPLRPKYEGLVTRLTREAISTI